MTIKDLRQLIANFPDDADVLIFHKNYRGWETASGVVAYSDKIVKVRDEGDGIEFKEVAQKEEKPKLPLKEGLEIVSKMTDEIMAKGYSFDDAADMAFRVLNANPEDVSSVIEVTTEIMAKGYSFEQAIDMAFKCLYGDPEDDDKDSDDDEDKHDEFEIGTGLVLCNDDY